MDYKTIFIDWDGTLSNSRFWEQWRDDHNHHGRYEAIQHIFTTNPSFIQDWMHSRFTTEEAVTAISQITKIDRDLLWNELIISCRSMTLVDPAIIPMLQKLRHSGRIVVLATDNMDTLNRWTLPSLGLSKSFDAVLNSFYLCAAKTDFAPDGSSKFFSHYLQSTNTVPSQCLLIDDSPTNKIITSIGLNFCLVPTTKDLLHTLANL